MASSAGSVPVAAPEAVKAFGFGATDRRLPVAAEAFRVLDCRGTLGVLPIFIPDDGLSTSADVSFLFGRFLVFLGTA